MTVLKASAVAHPSQAMIAFHGYSDPSTLTLPVDLLFCTIDNLHTVTTVQFLGGKSARRIIINGLPVRGNEKTRVIQFVDRLAKHYDLPQGFRIESRNSFPSNSGLGTSGSAFAALGKAIVSIVGDNDITTLSRHARMGSISAACSVVGGISILHSKPSKAWAESVLHPNRVPLVVVAIAIHSTRATAERHKEGRASPLYDVIRKLSGDSANGALAALGAGRIRKLGKIVEQQMAYNLALLSTGPSRLLMWQPSTLSVALALEEARAKEDLPIFLAMNSGPSLFCYAPQSSMPRLLQILENQNCPFFVCKPTIGAFNTEDHLF